MTTEITIKNTGVTGTYQELALSYLIPSGFEIINERLTGNATMPGAGNTDIRDDRFYVYFSLEQNQAKTFKFRCNAAFRGEYMLPAINCSAMYAAAAPSGGVTNLLRGGALFAGPGASPGKAAKGDAYGQFYHRCTEKHCCRFRRRAHFNRAFPRHP